MLFTTEGDEVPREGSTEHWELYQRARRERPGLVREVEQAIATAVDDELARRNMVNSSWLGSRVLDALPMRAEWDAFVPDRRASSGLFGMILWTLLADDPRSWVFTVTMNTNTDEPQRVFWVR